LESEKKQNLLLWEDLKIAPEVQRKTRMKSIEKESCQNEFDVQRQSAV
jgi:hypothetical protein